MHREWISDSAIGTYEIIAIVNALLFVYTLFCILVGVKHETLKIGEDDYITFIRKTYCSESTVKKLRSSLTGMLTFEKD